ncbi:MAG: hypothetical protein ACP5FH_01975 [Terracidiphilus sp.]
MVLSSNEEGTMQSGDNPWDSKPVNPFYAAAEKVAAAQRPFQVRKKSMKRSAVAQAWAQSRETLMIDRWVNAGQKPVLAEDRSGSGVCDKEEKEIA